MGDQLLALDALHAEHGEDRGHLLARRLALAGLDPADRARRDAELVTDRGPAEAGVLPEPGQRQPDAPGVHTGLLPRHWHSHHVATRGSLLTTSHDLEGTRRP